MDREGKIDGLEEELRAAQKIVNVSHFDLLWDRETGRRARRTEWKSKLCSG